MPDLEKLNLTGADLIKAAAKFAGVKEEDVFHAVDKGNGHFGVVTRDGRKFTETPKEREDAEKEAERLQKARAAQRAAEAARRSRK